MNISEQIEKGLKECVECYGTGLIPDSYNLSSNKWDTCPDCNGTGYVPYTEEDAIRDKEDECISNSEMMNDGD